MLKFEDGLQARPSLVVELTEKCLDTLKFSKSKKSQRSKTEQVRGEAAAQT